MAPNRQTRSMLAFAVTIGGVNTWGTPAVTKADKPARKPLVGKGSKWHRRMVESGRK